MVTVAQPMLNVAQPMLYVPQSMMLGILTIKLTQFNWNCQLELSLAKEREKKRINSGHYICPHLNSQEPLLQTKKGRELKVKTTDQYLPYILQRALRN
jgi:hypothetical protein